MIVLMPEPSCLPYVFEVRVDIKYIYKHCMMTTLKAYVRYAIKIYKSNYPPYPPPMLNVGRVASSAKTSPYESLLKVLYFINIKPNKLQ